MQTISVGLQASYDAEAGTFAKCLKITRADGEVFGFTTLDRDLVVSGVTYQTARGVSSTNLATGNSMNVDSSEMRGMITSDAITEDDLRAGLWDYAAFRLFEVDYADLSKGERKLRKGRLGEVSCERETFVVETLGLMQALSTSIGVLTSPGCRNDLGDAKCQVDLGGGSPAFSFSGTITSISSDSMTLTDSGLGQAAQYFQHGVITFTSGANDSIAREIKSSTSGGALALQLPFPYTVMVGDTFSIVVGCDKKRETCRDKFSNVINFQGEPLLAGNDKMVQVGRDQ